MFLLKNAVSYHISSSVYQHLYTEYVLTNLLLKIMIPGYKPTKLLYRNSEYNS